MLEVLAYGLFFGFLGLLLTVGVLWVRDVTQHSDAVRRNYPVIGRFRGLFITLGEFFRQYLFAMDREELPFNRAQREWVYQASKAGGQTIAFGSTKPLDIPGTPIFINAPFPKLAEETRPAAAMEFGPYCAKPYFSPSIFNISGMSYGAMSGPAIRALARGASQAGIWINTGEGAVAPPHRDGAPDVVFQIGTAKFGVRKLEGGFDMDKLKALGADDQIKMFEIKLSQGAKPGKGGILPGAKINEKVARIRGIPVGQDAISPNRHPEIKDSDSLLDMIALVRGATGKPVGFKAVFSDEFFLDNLCQAILRRGAIHAPDFITVDGGEGGTGASPMPLMDHVGLPLYEALVILSDRLIAHGLKDRVRVVASGKLATPANVAYALALGADRAVSGRGFMFALGCIQALKCNQNTCPTGITTNDKRLQRGLNPADKAVKVATYARSLNDQVSMIAHSCGVENAADLARHHVRVVLPTGRTQRADQLFPYPAIQSMVR